MASDKRRRGGIVCRNGIRQFLTRWISFGWLHRFTPVILVFLCLPFGSKSLCQQKPAGVNPEDGIIHSLRLKAGIPLGGIGCGTFQMMTDGGISNATINNNWDLPTGDLKGSFAAIWTDSAGRKQAKALHLASPYGIPSVGRVDYRGQFPQAFLDYPDQELPVQVSLRAFSPLIPHDVKNSSVPAALFVFKITNLARAPVMAAIALSWENILGVGGTSATGSFADRTGNTVTPLPASEGYIGLRFGAPDVPSRLPTDRLRYNASANANYALMVRGTEPEWKITRGAWNALDQKPGWWQSFSSEGTVPETLIVGIEGKIHPAGVVSARFALKDRETKTVAFAVAWYTPTLWTLSGQEYGHSYQEAFPDASAVCRYGLENRLTISALTDEWQSELQRSSLPAFLIRRLINDSATVFTNTILTRTAGQDEPSGSQGLFAILESPGDGKGRLGGADLGIAAYPLIADWFPELWVKHLRLIKVSQSAKGGIPVHYGNIDGRIGAPTDQESQTERIESPDAACAYAFEVFRYFQQSGDQKFLDEFYPSAKHAIEYCATLDADNDGLPDGTTVFARDKSLSDAAYITSVWIGALIAAEKLATAMADRKFAEQCTSMLERAVRSAPSRFWNGRFLRMNAGDKENRFQTYQLAGQLMADLANESQRFPSSFLEPILKDLLALRSISPSGIPPMFTGSRSDAPATPWFPFAETFQAAIMANHGHALEGLELMRAIDRIIRSSGDPWSVPLEIDSSDKREARGKQSLAGTASWSFYRALCGTSVEMKSGTLVLTPHLPANGKDFTGPVFMPSFGSTVEYHAGLQRTFISFRLNRFIPTTDRPARIQEGAGIVLKRAILPSSRATAQVSASVGRSPVPGKSGLDKQGRLEYTFDSPVRLTAGQRVQFIIR